MRFRPTRPGMLPRCTDGMPGEFGSRKALIIPRCPASATEFLTIVQQILGGGLLVWSDVDFARLPEDAGISMSDRLDVVGHEGLDLLGGSADELRWVEDR